MPSLSRLGLQVQELVGVLGASDVRFALIGGLAVVSHHVIRATQDVDLLVGSADAERLDLILSKLGYRCLHRSKDAGNYLRGDQRADFLYASRPIARQLLRDALPIETAFGSLPVVSVEGLIGFKLQALTNDPRRAQDLADIRALMQEHRQRLNIATLRDYFGLFGREALLDEILGEL